MPHQSPVLFSYVGKSESSTKVFLTIWLVALAVYRIASTAQSHMGLFFDEAYYYHWAQLLDWGYYSKPPMVGWWIALTTSLFGVSEVTVKLAAPVLYSATAWAVFLIGRKLDDERSGFIAALIFSTAPIVGFNSLFITTDAPLFFFWALAMYFALLCLESNKLWLWVLLGVSLGFGMLSKYTYAALVLGLLIYIAWSGRWQFFSNWRFYLATAISLVIFSSNMLWNWAHDFIAFTHTKEIAKLDDDLFKPIALINFLITQVFVIGVFWVVYAVVRKKQWSHMFPSADAVKFLVATMSPILVLVGLQAFLSRAFPNWAGAFVVSASVLLAFVVKHASGKTLYVGLALNLILLSTFYHWPLILQATGTQETKKNSPYFRLSGWREAALESEEKISELRDKGESVVILSNSRDLLAYVGFYNKVHANDLFYWNSNPDNIRNHYDLKNNARSLVGEQSRTILFLRKDPMPEQVQASFDQVDFIKYVEHNVSPKIVRKYHLYSVENFSGYPGDNEKD